MRKTVIIVLGHEDVQLARANAFKKSPTDSARKLDQELAALAGSRYLMGGTGTYRVLSRGLTPGQDIPGANVTFVGLPVKKRDEIWQLKVEILKEDRRKGWVYIPVAISPVQNSGTKENPLYRAFALVIGYKEEEEHISGSLRFAALDTAAPFPLRWRRNGDEGNEEVQWPIGSGGGPGAARSGSAKDHRK